LFENKAFFNNFLPIDRSLIDNEFRNFDVNNLEIMLTVKSCAITDRFLPFFSLVTQPPAGLGQLFVLALFSF